MSNSYIIFQFIHLCRIVKPESKHKIQKSLVRHFNQNHDLDALYRTLDKAHDQIPRIKTITFEKTKEFFPNTNFVLYDVTTLAFETENSDDLRAKEYSKDCKFNTSQVVLALASNQDGLSIGYELFQGDKAEVSTLMESIESWKKLFDIQSVTFVADRAMMSEENLKLMDEQEYKYTEIDYEKIKELEKWDGLHGITTNINDQSATTLLSQYKSLWKIAECFRLNKHTLSMLPIYHFKQTRIETHIAICYMAFAMLRHIEYRVALIGKMSVNDIIEELMNVQASIVIHKKTQDKYRIPSRMSHAASAIYKAMNIKRSPDTQIYLD